MPRLQAVLALIATQKQSGHCPTTRVVVSYEAGQDAFWMKCAITTVPRCPKDSTNACCASASGWRWSKNRRPTATRVAPTKLTIPSDAEWPPGSWFLRANLVRLRTDTPSQTNNAVTQSTDVLAPLSESPRRKRHGYQRRFPNAGLRAAYAAERRGIGPKEIKLRDMDSSILRRTQATCGRRAALARYARIAL